MKVSNPLSFSRAFGIKKSELRRLGVLDPALNVDTKLFIDPMLLATSGHPEMQRARQRFDDHFKTVIKLLAGSTARGDVAWRNARRLLEFPEVRGTSLGYSAASIRGSGFGTALTEQLIDTAKQIVDLGVTDPDLFMALAVFEEGVGADRISDMTTNIILPDLLDFNERILGQLKVTLKEFTFDGRKVSLPENSQDRAGSHILLVPLDVLRDLPIAKDWSDISTVASRNASLRREVNRVVGDIWRHRTRRIKSELRSALLASKPAFETFLRLLKAVPRTPYEINADRQGLVAWTDFIRMAVDEAPLDLSPFGGRQLSLDDVTKVVAMIVEHFRALVEDKGVWKVFWSGREARPEKNAQLVFLAVADSYCKAYNLDLTPEADSGNGPVDFKISLGYSKRVLVEVKLSKNSKLLQGYERQLERYRIGEDTEHATYLVIDLGDLGRKEERLNDIRNRIVASGKRASEIVVVDATRRVSASKE